MNMPLSLWRRRFLDLIVERVGLQLLTDYPPTYTDTLFEFLLSYHRYCALHTFEIGSFCFY